MQGPFGVVDLRWTRRSDHRDVKSGNPSDGWRPGTYYGPISGLRGAVCKSTRPRMSDFGKPYVQVSRDRVGLGINISKRDESVKGIQQAKAILVLLAGIQENRPACPRRSVDPLLTYRHVQLLDPQYRADVDSAASTHTSAHVPHG